MLKLKIPKHKFCFAPNVDRGLEGKDPHSKGTGNTPHMHQPGGTSYICLCLVGRVSPARPEGPRIPQLLSGPEVLAKSALPQAELPGSSVRGRWDISTGTLTIHCNFYRRRPCVCVRHDSPAVSFLVS